jgi:hypothetical protein
MPELRLGLTFLPDACRFLDVASNVSSIAAVSFGGMSSNPLQPSEQR